VAESVTGSGTGSWTGSGATLGTRPPTPPATCCATPLERPLSFALGAPEGVYLSAVGMPISPPLVRAARPRQNDEKCLDLKKPQGDLALCAISKPHRGPDTRKPLPRNAEG
jgi:hypothetical protein